MESFTSEWITTIPWFFVLSAGLLTVCMAFMCIESVCLCFLFHSSVCYVVVVLNCVLFTYSAAVYFPFNRVKILYHSQQFEFVSRCVQFVVRFALCIYFLLLGKKKIVCTYGFFNKKYKSVKKFG